MLVVHYRQLRLVARKTQYREHEVAAAGAIDSARAQDQVLSADRFDGALAGELGPAVGVHGIRRVVFRVRSATLAVEDVVRRVVDQDGAQAPGFLRQDAGGYAVDLHREIALGFSLVYGRVGGGIDDDFRSGVTDCAPDRVRARQINAVAVERDHRSQRRERGLQFPAELPVFAGDEYRGHSRIVK